MIIIHKIMAEIARSIRCRNTFSHTTICNMKTNKVTLFLSLSNILRGLNVCDHF